MSSMILCPTRGGKDSYPNQDWAVALAKERGVGVLFLYISNVEFLGLTAAPKLIDIEHELDEMGEFMLTMAQERAEKAEVSASTLVMHGHFRDVLCEVIEEHEIGTVVLGSSTGGTGVVTESYIQSVIDEIHGTTEVEFIIVDSGEIVNTYKP
ncbi:MAG: universal stress protein [Anaerolineales bacterium]|nr:universal stress protein [Anaerolineales bacterium]